MKNFKNLLFALTLESKTNFERFQKELNEQTDVAKILGSWQYNDLMTAGKRKLSWTLSELKAYLIERRTKKDAAKLKEQENRLQYIYNAGKLKEISISVEWKKSRMWGNNPTAEIRVRWERDNDYRVDDYTSGCISGCGYDKESTAIARAVNNSNEFLRAMYALKDKNVDKQNHDLFGYGSGYGILPQLEGGVGVSCYPKIFATIGYTFTGVSHGKTFDVYQVTKGVKK